jgi:hypothetical protein
VSWNHTKSSGKPRWGGGRNIFFSFLAEGITIAKSALTVKKEIHVNLFENREYILVKDDNTGG